MASLEGKTALIIGATGGIGSAIVSKFAEAGASLIFVARNAEVLEKQVQETSQKSNVKYHVLDLANNDETEKIVSQIVKENEIDILVNAAGIYYRTSFFESTSKILDETLNVNINGPFICSKLVSQSMMKKLGGVIINLSSNAAIMPKNDLGIEYGISKAALNYLTQSLALTLAQYNIRVNAIAPGYTNTKMQDVNKEKMDSIVNSIPLKRLNEPEDIANLALFLASEEARNITGQIIGIDGGYSLN